MNSIDRVRDLEFGVMPVRVRASEVDTETWRALQTQVAILTHKSPCCVAENRLLSGDALSGFGHFLYDAFVISREAKTGGLAKRSNLLTF
jgi:hypothetical protein